MNLNSLGYLVFSTLFGALFLSTLVITNGEIGTGSLIAITVLGVILILCVDAVPALRKKPKPETEQQVEGRAQLAARMDEHRAKSAKRICPYCNAKGSLLIRTDEVKEKSQETGVGALIGQSRVTNKLVRRAECNNCGMSWDL